MPLVVPSKLELEAISDLIEFKKLRVLEIGCGDGRLSYAFADRARSWVATDPDPNELQQADRDTRRPQTRKLHLAQADGRGLPFADNSFDIAFFTWSLC
jgi:ubiquinone/menaquinone biosynthesis C-methylase UbiE